MSSKQADIGNVPDGWIVDELRAFCSLITYGFTSPMPDAKDGPWKLTAKDIVDGRINYNTARRTTQEAFDRLTDKSRPKLRDVLLTKDGSIGRVAVVDREGLCINQSVALLRTNDRIIPEFLKYLLSSPHYQGVMEGDSDGSTIKHIYITRVDKMQVAVPNIAEQEAILSIVGVMDDRIALLRETNQTLEAIVQGLFKSWFVDFDPLRTKIEGSQIDDIDEVTASLFPNSFQDSELGSIPEGWEVSPIAEILNRPRIERRFTKNEALSFGTHPIYEQGASILLGFHNQTPSCNATPDKPLFIFGDHTCIMKISCEPFDISQNVILLEGSKRNSLWTYFAVQGKQNFEEYRRHWMELIAKKVAVPPIELCDLFAKLTTPLQIKIEANARKIYTLTYLRDTLLPRLIAGQISVSDAESKVENITA